jgi:hypothetical protein
MLKDGKCTYWLEKTDKKSYKIIASEKTDIQNCKKTAPPNNYVILKKFSLGVLIRYFENITLTIVEVIATEDYIGKACACRNFTDKCNNDRIVNLTISF